MRQKHIIKKQIIISLLSVAAVVCGLSDRAASAGDDSHSKKVIEADLIPRMIELGYIKPVIVEKPVCKNNELVGELSMQTSIPVYDAVVKFTTVANTNIYVRENNAQKTSAVAYTNLGDNEQLSEQLERNIAEILNRIALRQLEPYVALCVPRIS